MIPTHPLPLTCSLSSSYHSYTSSMQSYLHSPCTKCIEPRVIAKYSYQPLRVGPHSRLLTFPKHPLSPQLFSAFLFRSFHLYLQTESPVYNSVCFERRDVWDARFRYLKVFSLSRDNSNNKTMRSSRESDAGAFIDRYVRDGSLSIL